MFKYIKIVPLRIQWKMYYIFKNVNIISHRWECNFNIENNQLVTFNWEYPAALWIRGNTKHSDSNVWVCCVKPTILLCLIYSVGVQFSLLLALSLYAAFITSHTRFCLQYDFSICQQYCWHETSQNYIINAVLDILNNHWYVQTEIQQIRYVIFLHIWHNL